MSSNVNTTSIRTTTPPTRLTISLNFRALSQSSNYNFDHDHALNPPASGYTGEAYSAISDLTCASDAKVVDWLRSPGWDWEIALDPIDIPKGPDRWLDSIPQRSLQSHGSTTGNYEDDDGLSYVEVSSDEGDGSRDDYTGVFYGPGDPASAAILDM
ncbi:hypothetical protein I204_07998 [Kwoniella mangroviensis CBS 8886]|nr:hypothetical protein I204_07998 [Kwoniella mangroviensis CBS 8886]